VDGAFGALAALAVPERFEGLSRADNPQQAALLKRYDGSFIISYERLAFTDFTIPLSKLEKTSDSDRDRMNNQVYKPNKLLEVEGARTRITYLLRVETDEEQAAARRLQARFPNAAIREVRGHDRDDPIGHLVGLTVER